MARRSRYPGVVKRGDRWAATAYIDGKKVWIGTFDTEEEAAEARIEALRERRAPGGQETIDSFAARYPYDYNRTTKDGAPRWGERTVANLVTALKPFRARYGSMRLRDFARLSADDVRPWVAAQPTTYAQKVRTMLNDAIGSGLIDRHPLQHIRLEHSRGRRDIAVLSEEQVEELCALARSMLGEFGPTFEAMIATAAYTCIRPGELFALRRQDVDLKAGTIDVWLNFNDKEIKRPKNGEPRPGLVLLPQAAERIAAAPRYLEESLCPKCHPASPDPRCIVCEGRGKVRWLFQTLRGGIFRKSKLHYYWKQVRAAFGRPDMDWYDLRHAGATMMLERGVEPEDVAWQMGHTDGGKLVRELYGEPHRALEARRARIRAAWGANVRPLLRDAKEAANG